MYSVSRIIDNFLPEAEFKQLQEYMMSSMFPWYYNDAIDYEGDGKSMFIYAWFMHNVWNGDSRIIQSILDRLDPLAIQRIKANLLTKDTEVTVNNYHTDHGYDTNIEGLVTAIYYVNSNNGKTIFKDGTEIESVENRLIVFDANLEHTGTTASDDRRIVINFNYFAKPNVKEEDKC